MRAAAEAKPHSEGCRERIRQATMNDEVDQQRLHAAEQRVASVGGQQAVATGVEAGQESQDEENDRSACSKQGEARQTQSEWRTLHRREHEDQKRCVRRTTRVSRQLTSRRWASAKMAVILKLLGVAPTTFKVAEWFCRNRFGDAAVDGLRARPRSGLCDKLEHE